VNRWQSPSERFIAVRTPTKKYVKYDSGFEELFDLSMTQTSLTTKRPKLPTQVS
jgi:hypothetical protein